MIQTFIDIDLLRGHHESSFTVDSTLPIFPIPVNQTAECGLEEPDLRINIVQAWMREDSTFRSALEDTLFGNAATRLSKRQESDAISQLNQRLLSLEREIAEINKQKSNWSEKFSIWTTVANNLTAIILAIPPIGGLIYGLFNLLHH